jgi:hypothetical protein
VKKVASNGNNQVQSAKINIYFQDKAGEKYRKLNILLLLSINLYFSFVGQLSQYSDGLRAGWLGFNSQQEQVILLCSTASRQALQATQPHIQWVPGALFPGIKQQGCEADHSPPSSTNVKNCGAIPPFPIFMPWCLIKQMDKFTLYLMHLKCGLYRTECINCKCLKNY